MTDAVPVPRQQRWVAKASRAPSAHNTQPARWHFADEGSIYLIEDRMRHLTVADPHRNDHKIGLGAAFEGMSLAASEEGVTLARPEFDVDAPAAPVDEQFRVFARTSIQGECQPDPLASFVDKRATYRGRFIPSDKASATLIDDCLGGGPDVILVAETDTIRKIADLYDHCASAVTMDDDYYAELYKWLRFSRAHRDWDRDGLSADALAMGTAERIFGPYVAHPIAFNVWKRLGLTKFFVSEKRAICSADVLLIFTQDKHISAFEAGCAFYRLWLRITSFGLALCPMSALVDYPDGQDYLRKQWPSVTDRNIVNVFRVGRAPEGLSQPAARLPVSELIL